MSNSERTTQDDATTATVWLLGDQLMPNHPLLDPTTRGERQIVMIESLNRLNSRPYHKKKIVLVLSAMRHYATELKLSGWQVDYRQANSFTVGLQDHLSANRPTRLLTMQAAEWRARQAQLKLSERLGTTVEVVPNSHFLIEQLPPARLENSSKKLIMEQFYRQMRKHFGVLIEADGSPTGGNWNYDAENRKPYKGKPRPPAPPSFAPDEITREVMAFVEETCPDNLGSTEGFDLPVTRQQALLALQDFIERRLPYFGTYEDAMASAEPTLFHSLLSPLLNLGLLNPLEVITQAELAFRRDLAPLNAVEGFIRQVLGWREYVYWRYHRLMPEFHSLNYWQAQHPLPAFYYDGKTDLNCLHKVITKVLSSGYSHHIERLMVLCNFGLLAGIEPQAINNWFLEAYFDAYDWVVTPNVIGMGLCADGGIVGTKPYIASAAYINRMSDYCAGCRYNPKLRTGEEACPFNYLYWNFLLKWEERLRANARMGPNVLSLKYLSEAERIEVQRQATAFLEAL
jgi:deoxyribodipyrimidine photolyase-related protein